MRPYTILLLLALIVSISCSKDKDAGPVSKLVGTWTGVSSTTTITVGNLGYKEYLISQGVDESAADLLVTLAENTATLSGFFSELEIKADNSWKGHTEILGQAIDATGKWTLSSDEKQLTLTSDLQPGVEKHATITTLNDTDLVLDIPGDEVDGAPEGYVSKVTAKLTRKK